MEQKFGKQNSPGNSHDRIAEKVLRRSSLYGCLLISGFALLVRLPLFSRAALTWDCSEYVYCIQNRTLPHSPYLVHFVTGWLLGKVLPPDFALSLLSLVSSVFTVFLFGLIIRGWTRSVFSGWIASLVLSLTPVSITYSGIQEVYPYQFFWICLSWWILLQHRKNFLAGITFGAAFGTHMGSIFAFPATCLLLLSNLKGQVFVPDEGRDRRILGVFYFLLGMIVIPILGALCVFILWCFLYGTSEAREMLPEYLKGLYPGTDFRNLFRVEGWHQIQHLFVDVWKEMASSTTLGSGFLCGGTLALCLSPLRFSFIWWLLGPLYVAYEILGPGPLDAGIYSVFVLPSLAAGLAACVRDWKDWKESLRVRLSLGVVVGSFLAQVTPLLQYKAIKMQEIILPSKTLDGSSMVLAEFVREHAPRDALVMNPLDWSFAPFAASIYTDRESLVPTLGSRVTGGHWKPLYEEAPFSTLVPVTSEMMEHWIEKGRPILSFDSDPFTSFGCNWRNLDPQRFETVPILWLDRNETGTSVLWNQVRKIRTIDIGKTSEERKYRVLYPPPISRGNLNLPVFRPTLFAVVKKSGNRTLPPWAENLKACVPEDQKSDPPHIEDDGVSFEDDGLGISMRVPTNPGTTHVIRLTILSNRLNCFVECDLEKDQHWVTVGRDLEHIMEGPYFQFAELYFRIPGKLVAQSQTGIRFREIGEHHKMSVFRVDIGELSETESKEEPSVE